MVTLILVVITTYIYTPTKADDRDAFNEYVIEEFYDIAASYGIDPSNLVVYEGIEVVNLRNKGMFYPVYENGKLKYALEVYKTNKEFGFVFPGDAVDALRQLFDVSKDKITIFAVLDSLYGYTGDYVVDFSERRLIGPKEFKYNLPLLTTYNNQVIEFVRNNYEKKSNDNPTKIATPSWTMYFRNAGYGTGCVPQTLFNIYRNYGKSEPSWEGVRIEMNGYNGISGYYEFTHSQIQTYLYYKGVSTTYYSTSVKLAYNTCDTVLGAGYFIMLISSGTKYNQLYQPQTVYHATALVGTPTSTTILIADPHGTTDTKSISYSVASFYSSGIYYTWNAGYYSYLTY